VLFFPPFFLLSAALFNRPAPPFLCADEDLPLLDSSDRSYRERAFFFFFSLLPASPLYGFVYRLSFSEHLRGHMLARFRNEPRPFSA